MGRVLQLTASYSLSFSRLSPPLKDAERLAVRATLRDLQFDELPGVADYEALLSPPAVGVAWVRQVTGHQLWILYRIDGIHVALCQIAERTPVRVDD